MLRPSTKCPQQELTQVESSSFRFSFEKLKAYGAAQEALALVVKEGDAGLKGAPGEIGQQLRRALVSVCLNLAEGAGRGSPSDQRRHYHIAFGSAAEAMAALQMARTLGHEAPGLAAAEGRLREAGRLMLGLIRATGR